MDRRAARVMRAGEPRALHNFRCCDSMRKSMVAGGLDAAGAGAAFSGGRAGRGRGGAQPAAGEDRGAGRLGGVRAAFGRHLRRAGRPAILRPADPVQVPAAGAVVRAVRPGPGGSALGPALVPPLRRARAGRPGARPLDLLALSHGAGRAPAERAAARRAEPAARRQRADGQGGHADRRLAGRGGCPATAQG